MSTVFCDTWLPRDDHHHQDAGAVQRHELDAMEHRVLVGGRNRKADVARGLRQDVRGGRQQVVDHRRVADLLAQPGLDARHVPGRPAGPSSSRST